MVTPLPSRFCLPDRVNDIGVGGATAQISTHILANSGFGFSMTFGDASHGGEDLPWRAVPALKRVMVDEGLLHRVQLAVGLGEALDCRDIFALRACCQSEARQNTAPVDQYRASPALSVIATLLGSRETDVLAKRVRQRRPDVDRHAIMPSIYCGIGDDRIAWICRGCGCGVCRRMIKQSGRHCRCHRGSEKTAAAPWKAAVCLRHHRDLQVAPGLRSESGRPLHPRTRCRNYRSRLLYFRASPSKLRTGTPSLLRECGARRRIARFTLEGLRYSA